MGDRCERNVSGIAERSERFIPDLHAPILPSRPANSIIATLRSSAFFASLPSTLSIASREPDRKRRSNDLSCHLSRHPTSHLTSQSTHPPEHKNHCH